MVGGKKIIIRVLDQCSCVKDRNKSLFACSLDFFRSVFHPFQDKFGCNLTQSVF